MKFRLRKGKGSVSGYTDVNGVTFVPGDIVDLPACRKGEKWLECVKQNIDAPMVPVAPKVEVPDAPLVEKSQKKKPSKKK